MVKTIADTASRDRWTLIRGARQLLTLHGPTGPRRGSALGELNVIEDGALLIHNGVIREAGPARRVENLTQSRRAFEINVGGRIVLPAFVDPDAVLVVPPMSAKHLSDLPRETSLRVLSLRRLEAAAAAAAADCARSGTLSVGAHTGYALDLRDTVKVLRIHHAVQGKPLRIRSILSPFAARDNEADNIPRTLEDVASKWLPAIRRRKLAAMLELTAGTDSGELSVEQIRLLATVAASVGFSIRIRGKGQLDPRVLEFALEAGAVSIIAPAALAFPGPLADIGCLHIIPVSEAFREDSRDRLSVRQTIDAGTPIALTSGARTSGGTAFNPQFLLHLACDRPGISCEEAIVAATYNAACALRTSHVTGSLEPGKSADLAVMGVADYRELARRVGHNDVELVIRAGEPVYRRASLNLD